jgi:hypothetical protein
MSGAVLQLQDTQLDVVPARQGVLTLADGAAVSVYVARLLPPDDGDTAFVAPRRFAVRHACMRGPVVLATGTAAKLRRFLEGLGPEQQHAT